MSTDDLQIELIYMQTGTTERPGGQQAGAPATAVRVTHLPTLTMAQCGIHRSQHRNKQTAMEMLEWALS
jgi:peptide chain release factor 1